MRYFLSKDKSYYAVDAGQEFLIQADWVEVSEFDVVTANPQPSEMPLTPEQIATLRRQAYQLEADPLFFKAQRGEATEQEWLDKIEEIRARYPE
jgi:hypothetical protein